MNPFMGHDSILSNVLSAGWIRSQCYVELENGSGIVLVGNKNRFEVDIQPEDCDYTFGEPLLGAQLIAKTNGEHEVTYVFERWESRYNIGNQQCRSILGGGHTEERSADIVATNETKTQDLLLRCADGPDVGSLDWR